MKVGVVVSTMFSRLLEVTDATTGLPTPLFAKALLKALRIPRESNGAGLSWIRTSWRLLREFLGAGVGDFFFAISCQSEVAG